MTETIDDIDDMHTMKQRKEVIGPFVAIGDRGVVLTELKRLEPPLVLGRQPILPKSRKTDLWARSCSWIQNSHVKDPDHVARFTLLELKEALRTKQAIIIRDVRFRHGASSKIFTCDLVTGPRWDLNKPQPQYLGVINADGYAYNRIESKAIHENDGKPSRNRHLLGVLIVEPVVTSQFWEAQYQQPAMSRWERNPKARMECIRIHGIRCTICHMSFSQRYGPKFEGFIHVHHLTPLPIGHEAHSTWPREVGRE